MEGMSMVDDDKGNERFIKRSCLSERKLKLGGLESPRGKPTDDP